MWERTAQTLFDHAKRRLDHQIDLALSRAYNCLGRRVPYVFGGKSPDGFDCSGLVTHCFPRVLPDGVEKQAEWLAKWLFHAPDLHLAEPGDLVFFSEAGSIQLSHVGIVDARITVLESNILHSSERLG